MIMTNANKINSNKKHDTPIYSNFLTRFIFIFLFIEAIGQSEIKLVIQGGGEKTFLNSQFYQEPNEVIVNGISKPSCKKSCEFGNGLNEVKIKFDNPLESCANMFDSQQSIIEIDLSNFDTSKVINMYRMFSDCVNVQKINLENINTSLVQNMDELFNACKRLTYINKLDFDTSSVVTMRGMFANCESILSIVAEFNPQNVVNMENLFANCFKVVSIKLPNFRGTKVTNVHCMFFQNYKLKYLDLPNFSHGKLTTFKSMFRICSSLIYINIPYLTSTVHYTNTWGILDSTPSNLIVCILHGNTRYQRQKKYPSKIFDCSNICFSGNIKLDLKENKCVKECEGNEYIFANDYFCYRCPLKIS